MVHRRKSHRRKHHHRKHPHGKRHSGGAVHNPYRASTIPGQKMKGGNIGGRIRKRKGKGFFSDLF